jgi:peptide deformylase
MKINNLSDYPALKSPSPPVDVIDKEILSLVEEMREALGKSEHGIGLAAPQVGRNLRLFVISPEMAAEAGQFVFINPEITKFSKKKITDEEGCLSIPAVWGEVARAEKVTVKALNDKGEKFKLQAKGLLARLIQHEVDHLNGVLFTDHIKK